MTEIPPAGLAINAWLLEIDDAAAVVGRYAALLDPAEAERAGRFRASSDAHAYITARGALRLLLGRALGRDPRALELVAGVHGKPALAAAGAAPQPLQFNLSHSGSRVLLALCRDDPVGVDIEAPRVVPDQLPIARRFFSAGEAAALAALPVAQQQAAFFRCWTRKEAYLKAHGTGLSGGLGSFSVSLDELAPPQWFRDPAEPAGWTLLPLAVPDGYCAAIAWRGGLRPVALHGPLPAARLFTEA